MHAIHPHIPRPVLATLVAAALIIVLLLVLASRAGDISFSSSSGSNTPSAAASAPPQIREPASLTNLTRWRHRSSSGAFCPGPPRVLGGERWLICAGPIAEAAPGPATTDARDHAERVIGDYMVSGAAMTRTPGEERIGRDQTDTARCA
jgi:hypothetical protein